MSKENPWLKSPATDLTNKAKPGQEVQVTYATGITYNGGTVVNGEWFAGYDVPPPIVPNGFELYHIGVGLDLNSHPPRATAILREVESDGNN